MNLNTMLTDRKVSVLGLATAYNIGSGDWVLLCWVFRSLLCSSDSTRPVQYRPASHWLADHLRYVHTGAMAKVYQHMGDNLPPRPISWTSNCWLLSGSH